MMEGSPAAEAAPVGAAAETRRRRADGAAPGAPHGAAHPAIELSRRARFEVLGAILLALLLGALDQTIVGTALPTIVTDLHGNDLYTWVVTIYLLTSTIAVPFYGKLSDIFGRKPLLLFGITTFLIGSALSGLSQTMEQLILFRGIQGIGAGVALPDLAGRHRRPLHARRARQVPGSLRGGLRPLRPRRDPPSAASSPTTSAGTGSSSSTSRSGSSRSPWSPACCPRSGGRTGSSTSTGWAAPSSWPG